MQLFDCRRIVFRSSGLTRNTAVSPSIAYRFHVVSCAYAITANTSNEPEVSDAATCAESANHLRQHPESNLGLLA
ncbi:MAG: hypothetical protein ABJJ53_09075 [Sulfitobacter sp.]